MRTAISSFSLIILTFFVAPYLSFAQPAEMTPITLGMQTSLHSEIMGEERPIMIYTPNGYEQSSVDYPVVYLLDGDGHLLHTAGIAQFLSGQGKMPEVIIVALPNTDRTRDLTPEMSSPNDNFPTAGGADTFLSFIADELVPYIESNYRTAPYRILIGHSFGGIFSVNALLKKPELFNAHISISPSLWWDNKGLLPKAEAFLKENRSLRGFYYMTMGNEGGSMLAGAWGLAGIFEEHAPLFLRWHFELMEEETHGSIPHRSTYDGFEMLFDGWSIQNFSGTVKREGLAGVDKHYASLSRRFGYTIPTPESVVNRVGYTLLGDEKVEDAIAAFERNVQDFPGSVNVYDSVGDAYKANNEMKKAAESYQKACSMAREVNHPNLGVYCANAEALKDELD